MSKMELQQVKEWTKAYFKSFDSGEESYYNHFDSQVLMQGGNAEPTIGLDILKQAFESVRQNDMFSTRHNPLEIIVSDDVEDADFIIAVELSIDYKLKNGQELSLPCASIVKLKDSKVIAHKAFMDTAPFMEALSK